MNTIKYLSLSLLVSLIISCSNRSAPNYQYFPNMYESVGYETYQQSDAFRNGIEAQVPPEHTIRRGWLPYPYENTPEGYEIAKKESNNPLLTDSSSKEKNLDKGKELYGIYCAVCHGTKGNGQGILVKREKFLGIPSYKDRDITEGSIFYVIYYGRNAMGSHAAQLSSKERWQVTMYVEQLRNNLLK